MSNKAYFVWYDLMTNDIPGALAFYSEVIGWGTEKWKGEYTMLVGPRGPIGGLMPLPDTAKAMGVPPNWMAYVAVDDLDACIAKAASLGATVKVPSTQIPEVGSFAVLADPTGAAFAPFQAATPMPPREGNPQTREIAWHEVYTNDPAAAWRFYRDLFGWDDAGAMDMGEMGLYQMFKSPQGSGGFCKLMPGMPMAYWLYYFQVESVELAMEMTNKHGGKVLMGPMDVPGGRIAQCMDPQGAIFAVHATVGEHP